MAGKKSRKRWTIILPIIRAKGFIPIFSAISPVIKTTAAAPSFSVLAFAAVIVPRTNIVKNLQLLKL